MEETTGFGERTSGGSACEKPSMKSKSSFLNKLEEQPQSPQHGTLLQTIQAPCRQIIPL